MLARVTRSVLMQEEGEGDAGGAPPGPDPTVLQKQLDDAQAKIASLEKLASKAKNAGDAKAQLEAATAELEALRGKSAALEQKIADYEPHAKAWRAEQKRREDEVKERFGKLPEDTRKRLGEEPTLDAIKGFLAAFDASEAGISDKTPRPRPPVVAPAGVDAAVEDPFTMDADERRAFLANPDKFNAWLKNQGVNDRSAQLDPFGRPTQR